MREKEKGAPKEAEKQGSSFRKLPEFKGYTVDERLREFRKVTRNDGEPSIEYVPFLSEKGAQLLKEIIRESADEASDL